MGVNAKKLAVTWGVLVPLSGALVFLGFGVRAGKYFEAGSDLGYNLGLTGGLLMLSLLLYPLRKRFGTHDRLGPMPAWFRYHMVAGIVGPTLVLFHSTFRVGSMNGGMALYSMLLVFCSGLVGRFIYRHVHKGLYGRLLTLEDVSAELQSSADGMNTVYLLNPDIEQRIHAFYLEAFASTGNWSTRAWRFVSLRWKGRRLANAIADDARQAMLDACRRQSLTEPEMLRNLDLARRQVRRYLESVVKAAQLATWEKVFSLWHMVHIPFLYLLVFSGIVHVIAVHMY